MDSNKLYSYKCARGLEWVTGELKTHQTKAKVFSLRREEMQETRKGMYYTAELWTQGGYLLFSRDEIEVGVKSVNQGSRTPFLLPLLGLPR